MDFVADCRPGAIVHLVVGVIEDTVTLEKAWFWLLNRDNRGSVVMDLWPPP